MNLILSERSEETGASCHTLYSKVGKLISVQTRFREVLIMYTEKMRLFNQAYVASFHRRNFKVKYSV